MSGSPSGTTGETLTLVVLLTVSGCTAGNATPPAREAVVPVSDAGFVQGTTVAEQLRTFHGRLFRLDQHLQRLAASLEIVGVDPGISIAELADVAQSLVRHNHVLLAPGDDLGLSILVTPGPYGSMAAMVPEVAGQGPTVCLHTYPLPFHLWAEKYRRPYNQPEAAPGRVHLPRKPRLLRIIPLGHT